MAERFNQEGMEAFKDFYPFETCHGDRSEYRCLKCNHYEDRIELVSYTESWLYDSVTVKCEKCGNVWSFSV